MPYTTTIKEINCLNHEDASRLLKNKFKDGDIEDMYFEVVESKDKYSRAYEHISNEFNRRKSEKIEFVEVE